MDEKNSGGLWDLSAQIALAVAFAMRENGLLKNANATLYAEECGQECVYQLLKTQQHVLPLCEKIKKDMSQEAVSLEVNGELYFI